MGPGALCEPPRASISVLELKGKHRLYFLWRVRELLEHKGCGGPPEAPPAPSPHAAGSQLLFDG